MLIISDIVFNKRWIQQEIKKLQDNLQVQTGTFQNSSLLRTDFPEFQVKRPVIHRVNDQLKGSQGKLNQLSNKLHNNFFVSLTFAFLIDFLNRAFDI